MRLLVTADLHFNHRRSQELAVELIERMNRESADVLLLVGDTATSEPHVLESCLSRIEFDGPRLFVPGNHELWGHGIDSHSYLHEALPLRLRKIGWHDLQHTPFIAGEVGIVGSIGWYDYSFAAERLGIPRRFYERKVSPGAVRYLSSMDELDPDAADVPAEAREIVARWNDGKFIRLGRSDEQFLDELLADLRQQLDATKHCRSVLAAVHHLPFAALLPPQASAQWDFAKAYLGSERLGGLLLEYGNVKAVVCGHSHFPAEAQVGPIRAINIGSGYRAKFYKVLDVTEAGIEER